MMLSCYCVFWKHAAFLMIDDCNQCIIIPFIISNRYETLLKTMTEVNRILSKVPPQKLNELCSDLFLAVVANLMEGMKGL